MSESARVFIQLNAYADVARLPRPTPRRRSRDLHSSDRMGRFETTVIARDQHGPGERREGEARQRIAGRRAGSSSAPSSV